MDITNKQLTEISFESKKQKSERACGIMGENWQQIYTVRGQISLQR